MGKICLPLMLIVTGLIVTSININCQSASSSKVEFLNAPVLFKEGGKYYQQVIASYRTGTPGTIVFSSGGKELLKAALVKGTNRHLLTFPAVTKPRRITITTQIDNNPPEKYPVTLIPPKKWEVDFVQHSHTDIG
ncbi:MAG TPA: hypothetical protein DDW27_15370, partial [Bacteroidales bacterium]|nr:hypothetical protein [Bacteroidales bacterium]